MHYYREYRATERGLFIDSSLKYHSLEAVSIRISSGKLSLEDYKLIFRSFPIVNIEKWFKEDSENIKEEMLTRRIWYF